MGLGLGFGLGFGFGLPGRAMREEWLLGGDAL